MKKKLLALTLAGVMTLSGGMTVFAEDAQTDSATDSTSEELSGEDFSELLENEDGEGLDLNSLIGELSDEAETKAGELSSMINGVFESAKDENGNLNLDGILEGLGISGVIGNIFGEGESNSPIDGILEGLGLGELLDSFTDDEGTLDVKSLLTGLGLGDFLTEFSDEEGNFDADALMNQIVGEVTDENGELNLDGLVEQYDIAKTLDTITDENGTVDIFGQSLDLSELEKSLSGEDGSVNIDGVIDSVVGENGVLEQGIQIVTNPETWDNSGLLNEGSPVASFLDALGNDNARMSVVVESLKGENGEYSAENILGTIFSLMSDGAVDSDKIVLNGIEVPPVELGSSIKGAVESMIGMDLETLVGSITGAEAVDTETADTEAADAETTEPAA